MILNVDVLEATSENNLSDYSAKMMMPMDAKFITVLKRAKLQTACPSLSTHAIPELKNEQTRHCSLISNFLLSM